MLDRESTFAEPELLRLLREELVPVALDQAYQRRQQDVEGEFYRRIAGQGPRQDFGNTTQGFYVATADGELLLYNNNRDPKKVTRLVRQALGRFREGANERAAAAPIADSERDPRYAPAPPDGGLVVRVHSRVLGGYPQPQNEWQRLRQEATSRDNLWVTREEAEACMRGELPRSLLLRMARFHLVDATRGEPPMWREDEVRALQVSVDDGKLPEPLRHTLSGVVHLATQDASRGYRAELLGFVEHAEGRITRFDIVALGSFHGEGRYTAGAPPGEFPLAVRFSLADGEDLADTIPPQGSRGWLGGYLR